jgi:hypothetical protein
MVSIQENAWMDECLMIEWIHTVLEAPENICPFVLLDSLQHCHLMNIMKLTMNEAVVDYFHIPGVHRFVPACKGSGNNMLSNIDRRMREEEFLLLQGKCYLSGS